MIFQLSRRRASLDHTLSVIEAHYPSIQHSLPARSINAFSDLFGSASLDPANSSMPCPKQWGDFFSSGDVF
jgi:hypothetical protein